MAREETVLAVTAHADDMECMAGGNVLRGHVIAMVRKVKAAPRT